MAEIVTSILSLNPNKLDKSIKLLEKNFKILQIDVMDGKFVPRKKFTPRFVSKLKTKMLKEAHLMVANPEKEVPKYIQAGAKSIIFHIEAAKDPYSLVTLLKKHKVKVGIAINPGTNIGGVMHFAKKIDKILIMSVHPGEGGQKFIPSSFKKIKGIRKLNKKIIIEVDGGINKQNIKKIIKAGANHLVVGSALVRGDLQKNIYDFEKLLKCKT